MQLKKEVPEKAPRNAMGEIFFGTKLMALIVGLAAGLPLGMIYAFQSGLHKTCQQPIVVTISEVRTSPDPELDAYLVARERMRDMKECQECHSGHQETFELSEIRLQRMDDPDCRWNYEIGADRHIRRVPNHHVVREFRVQRSRSKPIRLNRKAENWEASPGHYLPDPLQYESF